jgi:hypothetical protein
VRRHREIEGVGSDAPMTSARSRSVGDEFPGTSGIVTEPTAIATSTGIGTSPGIEPNRNR